MALDGAFGTQVFKKTCTLMVYDVPLIRSSPCLGEVLHENQSNLKFDPQMLGSWVVMNIINGIHRVGSPCTVVSPVSRGVNAVERSTSERGMCWMYTIVYCWGKNLGLKGFSRHGSTDYYQRKIMRKYWYIGSHCLSATSTFIGSPALKKGPRTIWLHCHICLPLCTDA